MDACTLVPMQMVAEKVCATHHKDSYDGNPRSELNLLEELKRLQGRALRYIALLSFVVHAAAGHSKRTSVARAEKLEADLA
jgi:hypothetical protein